MQVRLLAVVLAIGAVGATNGCGDPTAIKAQYDNVDAPNITLYALNGTSPSLPSALQVGFASSARVDANFNFDIAFDLDEKGQVLAYPVRAVATQFVSAHRVGMIASDRSFAESIRAPTSGYKYDTVTVAPIGKTFYVDVIDQSLCSAFSLLGQNIRGKFVVDSVKVPTRQVFVHLFANRNCGFRSLMTGRPKD